MIYIYLGIVGVVWLIRMIENLLFHVALWQMKEYRGDRMRAHFSTTAGRHVFWSPLSWLKSLVLASTPVSILLGFGTLWIIFFFQLSWVFEASQALVRFTQHKILFPTFSLRSSVLLLITGIVVIVFPIQQAISILINIKIEVFLVLFLVFFSYAVIADRLLPILATLLSLATQPFVEWRKRQIVVRATRKIQKMHPKWIIGITGSYGKTSTKEFLAHILSRKFKVLKTSEHVNADIGIARQILKELKSEHEVYVVEMGAYHIGAIKRDCEMVQPNIGILTAIAPQHLSLFGSMENLIMAKSELFGALPVGGLGVTNGDQVVCHDIAKVSRAPVKFFGLRDPADVVAKKIEVTSQQLSFDIHIEKEHARVVAPLLGDLFVPNLLAAIAVAHYLGMTLSEIVAAIESLPGLPRTMEQRTGPGGIIIIDDSYSANPDGVVAALNALKVFPGRKYLVMPSMIELGTEYRAAHERVGEQAGTICNAIFLTDQDAIDHIKRGVERSSTIDKIKTSKNSTDLASLIFQSLVPGDVLLIEGRIPESLRQRFIL